MVSAGLLLLLVSGIQGSGQRSSVGGFECADATIRGTYGIQMHGTGPVPPPVGGSQTLIGVVKRTFDGRGTSRRPITSTVRSPGGRLIAQVAAPIR